MHRKPFPPRKVRKQKYSPAAIRAGSATVRIAKPAYAGNRAAAVSAICRAIGMADVAAGGCALQTCTARREVRMATPCCKFA